VGALCDGEVDSDSPAVDFRVAHGFLGRLGVLQSLEINEGETTRATSLSVEDNVDSLQRPELGKLLFQLPLCGVQAQPENSQAGSLLRILTVSNVPSSIGHRRTARGSASLCS